MRLRPLPWDQQQLVPGDVSLRLQLIGRQDHRDGGVVSLGQVPRPSPASPGTAAARDGAPTASLGASVSILPPDTHTRRTSVSASAWKSTGNRTSMPRSVRVPVTSSGQRARAVMRQFLRQLQLAGTHPHTAPPPAARRPRPGTVPAPGPRSAGRCSPPSRVTATAPQVTVTASTDAATTPISSTSRAGLPPGELLVKSSELQRSGVIGQVIGGGSTHR